MTPLIESPWALPCEAGCGRRVAAGRSRYCGDECQREARNRRRRKDRPLATICRRCREPFRAPRNDARYCSGRCRVAAHRARNGPD